MRSFLHRLVLLAAVVLAGAVTAADLPAPLERLQAQTRFPLESLSVVVRPASGGPALIELNPDVPRNPASTVKLVTTWAALAAFGPAYTWPTEIYALGPLRDGVLDGDLLIKGHGDPYMVTEELWRMLRALRNRGLVEIRGDLVIDGSHFELPPEDPGAFDGQPHRPYNVAPHAFLVNFRTVRFDVRRTASGVEVITDPRIDGLTVDNRIALTDAPCRGDNNLIVFSVEGPAPAGHAVLSGRFPRACRSYEFARAVLTPEAYAHGLFRVLWRELGGRFDGGVRTGLAPPGHRPLLTWDSRPLAEVIRGLNKWSNNTMARSLLLTLGADFFGPPGTPEKGAQAVVKVLQDAGIDTRGLHLVNGSGLARETRLRAAMLADMLVHAWSTPWMPELVSSLPIAGIDGTMRRRLKRGPETGRMHVKTGRLDHVSAVAGYVHGADGKAYVVVSIFNHPQAHLGLGERIHDAVLAWTYRESQRTTRSGG